MSLRRKIKVVLRDELGLVFVVARIFWAQRLSNLLPDEVGYRIRTALYRWAGVKIGVGSGIMGPIRIWGRQPLVIGSQTTINGPCAIGLEGAVTIGDRVLIGHDVVIVTGQHEIGPHWSRGGAVCPRPVVVENGVWIGARVLILPGVTIGAGSVIGGGAVVTRDIPPDTVAVGVPARVIRNLPSGTTTPQNPEASAEISADMIAKLTSVAPPNKSALSPKRRRYGIVPINR